jgi:predicted metalloendopeptidase
VTQETATEHGINLDDMDLSADPAEDFNQFANGGCWIARRSPRRGLHHNFEVLRQQTAELLVDLMTGLAGDDSLEVGWDE